MAALRIVTWRARDAVPEGATDRYLYAIMLNGKCSVDSVRDYGEHFEPGLSAMILNGRTLRLVQSYSVGRFGLPRGPS